LPPARTRSKTARRGSREISPTTSTTAFVPRPRGTCVSKPNTGYCEPICASASRTTPQAAPAAARHPRHTGIAHSFSSRGSLLAGRGRSSTSSPTGAPTPTPTFGSTAILTSPARIYGRIRPTSATVSPRPSRSKTPPSARPSLLTRWCLDSLASTVQSSTTMA
jgi:hypothetical protein